MKLNPDKCHLILSGKENREINVGNVVIKNSQNEKLKRKLKLKVKMKEYFLMKKLLLYNTLKTCVLRLAGNYRRWFV